MLITSKQTKSENENQPKKFEAASDIVAILQEADNALLANKPVVTHSCIRLAITEATVSS